MGMSPSPVGTTAGLEAESFIGRCMVQEGVGKGGLASGNVHC